ncbi:phosphotransferase family protein [Agromyces sp. MMS24-K17]|uniref:phosphotransferase family protein n=1 Tax=Agromyces sp. MMS24-K17 TaxID=3372850 RepID=UPI003754E0CF
MTTATPPLLAPDAVRAFLDEHGIGTGAGPIEATRIGDGQSNLTYLVARGGERVVLRRGPRPPYPPSAHDMLREARILDLLAPTGLPVPRVRAVCDDESVLGVPFYVMDLVPGIVIGDELPAAFDAAEDRRGLAEAAVDALAALHRVDVASGPLASIGRPAGFLERQVSRFASLWPGNTTRQVDGFDEVAGWLAAHVPASGRAAVVHGDFRIGNLLYRPAGPPTVAAILDWEMATLGDPLADLGYFLATYAEAGSPPTPLDLTPVTRLPGFPTRAELADRYERASGVAVHDLDWYQAFALWKGAVFCEAIHTRWLRGERPDDTTFAPGLTEGVPALIAAAAARIAR